MEIDEATLADLFLAKATPKQREAVVSKDDLIVISAGAGSGKTRTLSWRFAWLVATGSARHDEVLTITYTEKAAQEMEDRILSTLKEWLQILEGSSLTFKQKDTVSRNLKRACERFDEAQISTIHSFAMNLLKSFSHFLDTSPNFDIVSPPQEDQFYGSAVNALDLLDEDWFVQGAAPEWQERIKALFSNDTFKESLNFYGPRAFVDLARQACALFGSRGLDPEGLFEGATRLEDLDSRTMDLISALRSDQGGFYDSLYDFWIEEARAKDYEKDKLSLSVRVLQSDWKERRPKSYIEWAHFLVDLNDKVFSDIRSGGEFKKYLESVLSERFGHKGLKAHREALSCDIALARWAIEASKDRPLREILLKFSGMLWAIWEEHKKRHGILSFDDLLIRAKDLVASHPEAAGKYRHILVDEFQDTNGVQCMLIESIKAARQDQTIKLFVVGDLKQSIYRFRHANLEIFADYIRRAQGGEGHYIALGESFRMSEGLLKNINDLFGHLWRDGMSSSLKYPYEPLIYPEILKKEDKDLETTHDETESLQIVIEAAGEDKDGNKVNGASRKSSLALKLAGLFNAIHEGGAPWKDMVVLVPARSYYEALEEAFQRLEIPAVFVEQKSFFSRAETIDATAFLLALNDPEDDFAMIGLLSSPFLRLSQEAALKALASLKKENDRGRAWNYVKTNLSNVARKIEDLRRRAFLRGPADALNYLLEEPLWMMSLPPYKRISAFSNVRHLVHLLKTYEDAFGKDVVGAAWYLKETTKLNIPYEETTPLGEDEDVVRVMTVHAAKGLEFPIVAVFGLEHRRHPRSGSSLVPSIFTGAVLSSYPDPFMQKESPPSKIVHDYLEGMAQDEEKLRLLYVACTRAQKRLILCGSCSVDKEGNPSGKNGLWLKSLLAWQEEKNFDISEKLSGEIGTNYREKRKTKIKREPSKPVSLKKISLKVKPSPIDRLSATEYAIFSWCPRAYRLGYKQGLPLKWELPRSEDYGGPDVGSLMHWILAHWDLRKESLPRFFPQNDEGLEEVLRLLPTGMRPALKDKAHWDTLQDWLSSFAESPLGAKIKGLLASRKGQILREAPFNIKMDFGTRLVGQIDLLYYDESKVYIWDYKITEESDTDETSFMDLYGHQLKFYGYVVKRQFPDKALEMGLYLLRERKAVTIDTNGLSFDDVEKQIKDTSFRAVKGPFDSNDNRCPYCPWKNLCSKELLS